MFVQNNKQQTTISDIGEKSPSFINPFIAFLQIRTIVMQAYIGACNILMGQYDLNWLLTKTIPYGIKRGVLCTTAEDIESHAPIFEFLFGR